MQPKYTLNGETHVVEPIRNGDDITLEIDGHLVDVRIDHHDSYRSELIVNGVQHEIYVAQDSDKLFVHMDGKNWQLHIVNEFLDAGGAEGVGSGRVKAPMPGVVLEVNVVVGDQVEENQCLMLIESMKLQIEIKASVAGVVSQVNFEAGQPFDKASTLVEIMAETVAEQGEES